MTPSPTSSPTYSTTPSLTSSPTTTLANTTAVASMISDLPPAPPTQPCLVLQIRIQQPPSGNHQNGCMTQGGYASRGRAPRSVCQVGQRRTALGYQIAIYPNSPSLEPRRWGIRRPTQGFLDPTQAYDAKYLKLFCINDTMPTSTTRRTTTMPTCNLAHR